MPEPEHNPFAAPQSGNLAAAVPAGEVDFEALRTTGNGLRLIYFSLLLLVLLVLGVFVGTLLTAKAAGPAQSGFVFLLVAGTGVLLVFVLSLVGGLMCTTVPQQSGGKWLVIASVVIQVLSQLMLAGTLFLLGLKRGFVVASLLSGLSLILFLLFLGRLSSFMHRDDFRRRAKRMLILLAVYVVIVITTGMTSMAGALDFATVGIALIGGLGALILFVMFANLVNDLSTAIRRPQSAPTDSRGHL